MSSNCQTRRGGKNRRKDGDKCLVCNDESIGINFGVSTCSPCKAFFRRNAVRLGRKEFICEGDGNCPVTDQTRRFCNCCRLAKCFRVGMDRNSIRTEEQKFERKRLVEYNRQKRAETTLIIQPVNLLQSSFKTSLSPNDQALLTNIFSAYEQTCISLRYNEHLKMPNDRTLSLEKVMNSLSYIYISFVNYFKSIPQFANLSVEYKINLLKKNFNQIFRLNNALIVHATGAVAVTNSVVFKCVFPGDLYSELCHTVKILFPFVYDPIFLKLLFIVLMFSTSLSARYNANEKFVNTQEVLFIQNSYTELLWRYILYRCSTYRESVRLLTSFITCLLRSQIVTAKFTEFINQTMSNGVDRLEPIMKAMWLDEKQEHFQD